MIGLRTVKTARMEAIHGDYTSIRAKCSTGASESVLYWFSQEMYSGLLGRAQKHFLVKLHEHLRSEPLERACADYHHHSGPGAPVVHSVSRLVRALVVKFLLNLSLHDSERAKSSGICW